LLSSGAVAWTASVALAAGVSVGMRAARTGCEHPSVAHDPSQRTLPGAETVSVTCPSRQVPRTRTRPFAFVATGVDANRQL